MLDYFSVPTISADIATVFPISQQPRLSTLGDSDTSNLFSGTNIIQLLGEICSDYLVIRPIEISIDQDEDGSFIVSDEIFYIYGDGNTIPEAVNDYIISLRDYYQLILARVDNDENSRGLFNNLRRYISYSQT